MNTINPKKRWIELEMSMVDQDWYGIFPKNLWEQNAYDRLMEHVKQDEWTIKQEVINNMIEIVSHPDKDIDKVKKQILSIMNMCKEKIEKIGMNVSNVPRIQIKEKSIPSNNIVEYCVTPRDYYYTATKEILTMLKNPYDLLWAWCLATHIHMSAEDDEATLLLFKSMSNYAAKLRNKWSTPQGMCMDPQRYYQRNKIIEARKKLGHLVWWIDPEIIPENHLPYIYDKYFDENGILKRMHNIIAIKKPWDKLTVELRSPDGVMQEKKLSDIIDFTKKFVQEAIVDNMNNTKKKSYIM